MFFAPTVQALTAADRHNHVKILCLSTGNADGLGDVRRQELETAALTLGVRRRQDVFVLDDESRFRDGMREQWSPDEVARAREAMVHGHRSQMVWFRWGWITLGRYMLINDLVREPI
ncbi:hypothetical protein DV735_g2416, partial [Chaetothyriales sp. CBS 134920]